MTATEDTTGTKDMSLGDHLDELRRRLFKGVLAVVVCTVIAYCFRGPVYDVFMLPFGKAVGMLRADWIAEIEGKLEADPSIERTEYYLTSEPNDDRLRAQYDVEERPLLTAVGEGFITVLKVCLTVGLFVGGPVLLWQLWAFIAAGLYRSERSMALSFFPVSLVLFFAGVGFGYFVLVPYGMYYLGAEISPERGVIGFKLETYFTFMTGLCLALGVVFQLPLVMIALSRAGLIGADDYYKYRGHFVLGAFVIAAILTPPDPVTQTMMAGPMVILYEIGIWSSRMLAKEEPEAA